MCARTWIGCGPIFSRYDFYVLVLPEGLHKVYFAVRGKEP